MSKRPLGTGETSHWSLIPGYEGQGFPKAGLNCHYGCALCPPYSHNRREKAILNICLSNCRSTTEERSRQDRLLTQVGHVTGLRESVAHLIGPRNLINQNEPCRPCGDYFTLTLGWPTSHLSAIICYKNFNPTRIDSAVFGILRE